MTVTFSSREFSQDAGRVKRASKDGPVFITDRGKPAHVLMTVEAYERLKAERRKRPLVEFLESLDLAGLDVTRTRDTGREVDL